MIAEIMLVDGDEYRITGVVDWVPSEGYEVVALYDSPANGKDKPDPIALVSMLNVASIQFLADEMTIELELE